MSHSADAPGVALITGSGARRVGRTVAQYLASNNMAVALHYRSSQDTALQTQEEIRQAGGTAEVFQADVREERDVDDMIAAVVDRFGRLDVLVNTASAWQKQSLEDITPADLQHALSVDLVGTFLCARRAGLQMVQQATGGCIINFGDASTRQPRVGEAAYYLAKGGMPAITRMLAAELAARNPAVRVNAVLPGSVMTPASLSLEQQQRRQHETLTQTADDPESLCHAIWYLIRSTFVTGTSLTVDGGRGIRSVESMD